MSDNTKTPELEKYRAELGELTPYATEYRYPGRVANQEDAKVCVEKFANYEMR